MMIQPNNDFDQVGMQLLVACGLWLASYITSGSSKGQGNTKNHPNYRGVCDT
jgi:hypothetical protein